MSTLDLPSCRKGSGFEVEAEMVELRIFGTLWGMWSSHVFILAQIAKIVKCSSTVQYLTWRINYTNNILEAPWKTRENVPYLCHQYTKNPPERRVLCMVGAEGFEPPTSSTSMRRY